MLTIHKPSNQSNVGTPEGTENPNIDENSITTIDSESEAKDLIDLKDLLPEDASINYSGVMLPQTGESNSNLWFASSAVAVLPGLGLIKGRKEDIEQ